MNYTQTSDSSNDMTAGGFVFALVFLPMVTAISMIANAWALVLLWDWFVLPTFTTAPALTIPAALGLSLIVFLGSSSNEYAMDKAKKKSIYGIALTALGKGIGRPAFAVSVGYAVLILT